MYKCQKDKKWTFLQTQNQPSTRRAKSKHHQLREIKMKRPKETIKTCPAKKKNASKLQKSSLLFQKPRVFLASKPEPKPEATDSVS